MDAFYVFLFRQFFKSVPRALEEAALLDGASHPQIFRHVMLPAAKPVVVTVADDGPGMSRDTARRALEPFFTTKARGTGLGLPICKRIIEAHQGTLSIETHTGRGTTIRMRLPGSSGDGRPKERQT